MPPKKKEVVKKEDDVVDESTLPPWTSYLLYLDMHPYLQSLTEPFLSSLSYVYRSVSRSELVELAVEKELAPTADDVTPAAYAKAFKMKISQLEVAARVGKRDKIPRAGEEKKKPKEVKKDAKGKPAPVSPRSDVEELDPDLQDVIYIFYDYPTNSEEAKAIYQEGGCFNMLLHCRPTEVEIRAKTEALKEEHQKAMKERKEKADRGEDPGPELLAPAVPEEYPNVFLELQKLAADAPLESPAHNSCSRVLVYSVSEAASLTEEESEVRFMKTAIDALKQPAKAYLRYETWLKTIHLTPLFRTETRDMVLYNRLLWDLKEEQADETYFLLCLLYQVVRSGDHRNPDADSKTLEQHFSTLWGEVSQAYELQNPMAVTAVETDEPQTITNDLDKIVRKQGCLPLSKLSIRTLTQHIYDNLHLSGLRRYQMPPNPLKSEAERGEERTALESFASIAIPAFHRALVLTQFEAALKKTQPERQWDFGDRIYEERMNTSVSGQTLLEATLLDPEVVTKYDDLEDRLLVAVLYKAPQGRVYRQRWHYPWRAKPSFEHWHSVMKPQELSQENFLDVDSGVAGEVREKTKIFCPADDSVVKTSDLFIGPRQAGKRWWKEVTSSRPRTIVIKDDVIFGIRSIASKPEFWTKFGNNTRLLVEMTPTGAAVLLGSVSGLTIKLLPDGSVVQQCDYRPPPSYEVPKLAEEVEELNRVVTLKGTVIRYLKNGTIQILFANGNVSTRSSDKVWHSVNNKGRRRARRQKDGIEYLLDSLKVSTYIDPETSARVLIREDWTILVKYADGAQVAIHKDGTKMYTSPNKTKIVVEHPKYASLNIIFDPAKARQHTIIGSRSTDSGLGAGDVMMRSHDGLILEVRMDSGLALQSFVQKQEIDGYNQFSVNRISLVEAIDGSVIKVQQDGEVAIVSGGARRKLAHKGDGDPFAYFYELFSVPEDRSFGVYTADLKSEILWTKDAEGNLFTVAAAGGARAKLAVSLNIEDISGQDPHTPDFSEGEYVDPESRFLPPPPSIPDPRLFVVSANSEATEFLSEKQLESYFLLQKKRGGSVRNQEADTARAVSVVWRPEILADPRFEGSPLRQYGLPSNVGEKQQTEQLPAQTVPEHYQIRTFFQYEPFTPEDRSKFQDDLQRFKEWREAKSAQRLDWITSDPRNEVDKKTEQQALAKIQVLLHGQNTQKSDQSDEYRLNATRSKSPSQGSQQEEDQEEQT